MRLDMIDRAALLERMDEKFFATCPEGDEQLGYLNSRNLIRTAPAVDAAPVKHGQWLVHKIHGNKKGTVRRICSLCGANNGNRKSLYCPNCGAKMDGGGGGEVTLDADRPAKGR